MDSSRVQSAPGPHLLVLRFALVNVVGCGLAAAVYFQHWLDPALAGDTRWLSLAIVGVFLYGLVLCAFKVHRVGQALERMRVARAVEAPWLAGLAPVDAHLRPQVLRLRLLDQIAVVRHVAGSLVFLGLVGTVIGFIVALSGVDPDATADVERVGPMVAQLVRGMSIALYTTLIGAVLHLWLMIDYRLLSSGALALFARIVERGEHDVGA